MTATPLDGGPDSAERGPPPDMNPYACVFADRVVVAYAPGASHPIRTVKGETPPVGAGRAAPAQGVLGAPGVVACAQCAAPFMRKEAGDKPGRKQVYCSRRCRDRAYSARRRARSAGAP